MEYPNIFLLHCHHQVEPFPGFFTFLINVFIAKGLKVDRVITEQYVLASARFWSKQLTSSVFKHTWKLSATKGLPGYILFQFSLLLMYLSNLMNS